MSRMRALWRAFFRSRGFLKTSLAMSLRETPRVLKIDSTPSLLRSRIALDFAKQVLSWIICAKRFTMLELQCGLAVEIGESELDEQSLPQVKDMIAMCIGLVAEHL